ncbi:uncharacterized protein MYCFIDRAFT_175065 [Pseudocercospora fijiensis CIRAD86]|uniref:Uncharacterized protein n=1 Tax=Pseudocercospora fijiensis (strain CIRAD86) TaxID=383855 RepID=M3B2P6_PSEFD|nr:uncharacterized protein MYCFIDRAFT_175065 [Pseudocercospora fijiensis CIRAD86]EME83638.1 hypothetical protein MYCFIDRAFT_175065 [Pseudocercospora fijiensis CIRAD86]
MQTIPGTPNSSVIAQSMRWRPLDTILPFSETVETIKTRVYQEGWTLLFHRLCKQTGDLATPGSGRKDNRRPNFALKANADAPDTAARTHSSATTRLYNSNQLIPLKLSKAAAAGPDVLM